MKKLIIGAAAAAAMLLFALPAMAAKSDAAGATKEYKWNLSGAVMPVPPYGSQDIQGSDTASKLVVNMPNGKVAANLTGVMNGLRPGSVYTVYLSNAYKPYKDTGYSIAGNWVMSFNNGLALYDVAMNQTGSGLSGSATYPHGAPTLYAWQVTSGNISGSAVTFDAEYIQGADALSPLTHMHVEGMIASDGSISGTWSDDYQGVLRDGVWTAPAGTAHKTYQGDMGWTGQLATTTSFTFTADSNGSGSWHYNFKGSSPGTMSVWINSNGGTMLISDNISL